MYHKGWHRTCRCVSKSLKFTINSIMIRKCIHNSTYWKEARAAVSDFSCDWYLRPDAPPRANTHVVSYSGRSTLRSKTLCILEQFFLTMMLTCQLLWGEQVGIMLIRSGIITCDANKTTEKELHPQ